MKQTKIYVLSDWPVLRRLSACSSRDRQLDSPTVVLLYECAAAEDWAAMDQDEREFANAILASQRQKRSPPTVPFKAVCSECSSEVISWHSSCVDVPKGEKRGLVYCECGRVGADSSDVDGMGRVLSGDVS